MPATVTEIPMPATSPPPPHAPQPTATPPEPEGAVAAPSAEPARDEPAVRETVIEPKKGWIGINWREMNRSRELLYFLVWRDIKVRYKQAMLGVAWAVLQPLTQVLVFTAILGAGLNMSSLLGTLPPKAYPVFIFSGLLVWQVFARSLGEGGMSLVNQQHLLTKIYFPRLFVPTASVGGALFDLLVSLPVFAAMMAIYGVAPRWTAIFFPLLVAQTALLGAGVAYLLSALTVTYRDFRFIIPFLVQIWMWMSFVMLPLPQKMLDSPRWQSVFAVNPMYGVVSAVRKAVLGYDRGWNPSHLLYSVLITLAVFVFGMFYFRRTERRFADIA
jgi:lipopolysaccharide transport system permease protein